MIKKFTDVVDIINEENNINSILEALITFGGKAYPKFGQVVILSGGAGSGKGFVRSNLLGVEGIVLDVDRMKELVQKSSKYNALAKEMFGVYPSELSLKNPDNVSKLHDIVDTLGVKDAKMNSLIQSIGEANPGRLPNIIFDVTLKDLTKFYKLIRQVTDLGYSKENISLVWILNTIEVAQAQNLKRDRTVAPDILLATHQGASYSMSEIFKMGKDLQKYLDGDMYIAFNQIGVDSELINRKSGGTLTHNGKDYIVKGTGKDKDKKPFIVKKADYVHVKYRGKPVSNITDEVINKIKQYVPNAGVWDK